MLSSLGVAASFAVATILAAAAVGKWRDGRQHATDGVPGWMVSPVVQTLHPWVEIALALALVLTRGVLATVVAALGLALCTAYLVVVATLRRRPEPTQCACFGAPEPVTSASLVRNVLLVVAAVGALVAAATGHAFADVVMPGGDALATAGALAGVAVGAAAVGATILAGGPAHLTDDPADGDDYVRVPFPDIDLERPDGTVGSVLREAQAGPVLVMFAAPDCRACGFANVRTPAWRRLAPMIRFVHVSRPLAAGEVAPEFIHEAWKDPDDRLRRAAGVTATPGAVVVGTDGLTVAGPVYGADAINDLVFDVAMAIEMSRG